MYYVKDAAKITNCIKTSFPIINCAIRPQSPKFKRVSLNETPEFPIRSLNN